MKVALFNTYDFGGAAKACIRLHQGLLDEGFESNLVLKQKTSNVKFSEQIGLTSSLTNRLLGKARRIAFEFKIIKGENFNRENTFISNRPKGLECYSYPYSKIDITQSKVYQEADIINLHWVADFLDWKTFFTKNKKPVVWTLHDQNPFLGGEHYAERFLGMDEVGKPEKRVYTAAEILEERRLLDYKMNCLSKVDNLYIVCPSQWLLSCANKSGLLGRFKSFHIPNGFPTNIFKLYSRSFCREILGIPDGQKVILFVADSLENSRKGYAYLRQAISGMQKNQQGNVILCAIGNKSFSSEDTRVLELGRFQDERMMAMAYNAADVFVIPSLEDNLPNTMIESMLCGTPVIAFNTGGISDAVIDNYTGFLCPDISVNSLKSTIEKFLANPNLFDREKISGFAREKYSLAVQAKKYIELFESVERSSV
jgi:glycosyltransferase involved in cell wall biosynthesis